MKFEASPSEKHKYRLIIEDDDIEPVGATYRELLFKLAVEGTPERILDFYASIATWRKGDGSDKWIDCTDPLNIAKALSDFHKATPGAISEIPVVTAEPAFDNFDVSKRYLLGKKALDLSREIEAFALLATVGEASASEDAFAESEELPTDQSASQ